MLYHIFLIEIPEPLIFPLNNEQPRAMAEEIFLESEYGLKIYYSLDGTDPKGGEIYSDKILLESSQTIAARTKFFIFWSDISKSYYDINADSITTSTLPTLSDAPTPTDTINISNIGLENVAPSSNPQLQPEKTADDENATAFTYIGLKTIPDDNITNVSSEEWNADNMDTNGNHYSVGLRIGISNLINSITAGMLGTSSSNVNAQIHLAVNDTEYTNFSGKFVVDRDSLNNQSTAIVFIEGYVNNSEEPAILFDGTEISNSSKAIDFDIPIKGYNKIVIKIDCSQRGEVFYLGIVDLKPYIQ